MNNLTKLDVFALSAMQAIISNSSLYGPSCPLPTDVIVKDAYDIADAMMKESEKRQPKQEKEKVVIPDMKNDIA